MSGIENKAWLETIDRIVPPLESVHENFVAEWALWQDRKRIREELAALVEKPAVFASRYDEDLGACVPVEVDPPMLAKLRERVAVERKAEPVAWQWRNGAPPKPWSDEWFIAETTYGDRVVLRSLPEDWTYDFKTADDTYIKADKIKRWMQFPDSHYIPPPAAPVKGEGWQPIDTAPKGRKLVLLDCENWLNPVIGYFSETIGSWLEYGTRDTKANAATHWVHLPARAALSASPSPVDSRDSPSPKSEAVSEGGEDE
ncbi:hypothetical protein GOB25_07825 [Sinorhizobium meliloti]|nr:hypothetical protein [Sinorhizobium meliloti]